MNKIHASTSSARTGGRPSPFALRSAIGASRRVLLIMCFINFNAHAWFFTAPEKPFTILIEAGGDSAHPGRSIDDSFESAITFAIAQAIQQQLPNYCPRCKVILNRTAIETVAPLQNANFANKLDVDLYLSIHAYSHVNDKPSFYLYQFSYHDTVIIKDNGLSFYPFDTIYLVNQSQTASWGQQLKQLLEQHSLWHCKGLYAVPFKPLIGIKAPALGIEFGFKKREDWKMYGQIVAQAVAEIINKS